MNNYEITALLIIPITLLHFSIDYLSDREITKDETKLGILIFIHHLIIFPFFVLLFSALGLLKIKDYSLLILISIIILISQFGFFLNNDYCWLTRIINVNIDPNKPNRKWVGDFGSFFKKYMRGDSWAYSNIYDIQKTTNFQCLTYNILLLIAVYKYNK